MADLNDEDIIQIFLFVAVGAYELPIWWVGSTIAI